VAVAALRKEEAQVIGVEEDLLEAVRKRKQNGQEQ
jgi:hypothetical protein